MEPLGVLRSRRERWELGSEKDISSHCGGTESASSPGFPLACLFDREVLSSAEV